MHRRKIKKKIHTQTWFKDSSQNVHLMTFTNIQQLVKKYWINNDYFYKLDLFKCECFKIIDISLILKNWTRVQLYFCHFGYCFHSYWYYQASVTSRNRAEMLSESRMQKFIGRPCFFKCILQNRKIYTQACLPLDPVFWFMDEVISIRYIWKQRL